MEPTARRSFDNSSPDVSRLCFIFCEVCFVGLESFTIFRSRSNNLFANCFASKFSRQCFWLTDLDFWYVCLPLYSQFSRFQALLFLSKVRWNVHQLKLLEVYPRFWYCFKVLEEVFSLPPWQVGFIPLLLFAGVSLDVCRMFHYYRIRTQNFFSNKNLAILLNLNICDHCAHFPFFCRIFSITSPSYTFFSSRQMLQWNVGMRTFVHPKAV